MALNVPALHLVGPLGGASQPEEYVSRVQSAIDAGLPAVHVRLPGAPGGEVLAMTEAVLRGHADGPSCIVIVNDRVDVAMLTGARGVHLGERSVSVAAARSLVGPAWLIGRSIHDLEGARQAEQAGADYLFAGHVYETGSKPDQPGRGLTWLSEVCKAVTIPVIAIGGITIGKVPEVMEQGAHGIAVGREILDACDPGRSTAELLVRLEGK
jgi:thiamine-phosphate diphosphorylase